MRTQRVFACLCVLLFAGAATAAAQSPEEIDAAHGERLRASCA